MMRIAFIAAGSVGDFGLTFGTASADVVFVDHGACLVATQASGVKPSSRSDTLRDVVQEPVFILYALNPRATGTPA